MAERRVVSPLALSDDGRFVCPHCAAAYEVDHLHSLGRDDGAETCEDCGAVMATWSSSVVPVFKRASE